jgi:hypothetical protein
MNVIEAYIKFKGQLIILVSGMSGSGISVLGGNISRDFKIPFIDIKKLCHTESKVKAKLPNQEEIDSWDHDGIYDWDKLNEEMKDKKSAVIAGTIFPKDKLKFKPDFHIHIKLSKQNILKRREQYTETHKTEFCGSDKYHDKDMMHMIFNNVSFPYYLDVMQRSEITKYINANNYIEFDKDKYNDKIYDDAFDYLIAQITKYLDNINSQDKSESNEQKNKTNEKINDTSNMSEDLSDSVEEFAAASTSSMDLDQGRYAIQPDGSTLEVVGFD